MRDGNPHSGHILNERDILNPILNVNRTKSSVHTGRKGHATMPDPFADGFE